MQDHGTHANAKSLVVRAAALTEVIDLRHRVLRAGLPRATAVFDGDERPGARHVVAVHEGRVVGCATVHPSEWAGSPAWQLRGMATEPAMQRAGVGRAMLGHLERVLLADAPPVRQLWCNARVPAVGFYERLGWRVASDAFEIATAGPHVQMTKVLGGAPE